MILGVIMTHSEIVSSIHAHADELAEALKRGHDVELRLNPKVHSIKAYELGKYPLIGGVAVQGGSERVSVADDIKHVEAVKVS